METQLNFSTSYRYSDLEDGLTLPVLLSRNGLTQQTTAKVDTGAEVCLFSNALGVRLGLQVESGLYTALDSLGGPLEAFGHEVILQSCGMAFPSFVYFAKYAGLRRNLLGRQGWLRQLRIAVVDYENLIYLNRYDE